MPAGTIVGAFAVETCLGRKWTMVGGTAIAAAALYLFTVANSQTTVVLVTSITNLFSMIMFAAVCKNVEPVVIVEHDDDDGMLT